MKITEKEYGIKLRLLRIMRALIENPNGYNKQRLAEMCKVSTDTIERDLNAISDAGFTIYKDANRCYAFAGEKPYQQLKELIYFTDDEQMLLLRAINREAPYLTSAQAEKLRNKVTNLYDYRRLGYTHLRKPYLDKIDLLKQAKEEKRQVELQDYHSSNSNVITNRQVECFLILPAEDILQAFDIEKQELRHFRLSRINRVKILPNPWQHEPRHLPIATDPFRIVDAQQIPVHLRLKVGAYNELIERFPATAQHTLVASEPDTYDFQCPVNHRFLGLTNFILGFYHQLVEIVYPESLLQHLRNEKNKMNF